MLLDVQNAVTLCVFFQTEQKSQPQARPNPSASSSSFQTSLPATQQSDYSTEMEAIGEFTGVYRALAILLFCTEGLQRLTQHAVTAAGLYEISLVR